jgi:hypothetical protein
MKHLKTPQQLNEESENLTISDVMQRINSYKEEYKKLEKEWLKSDDDMNILKRKSEIEKHFKFFNIPLEIWNY